MRRRLHGPQTPGNALPKHHPILDIGVGCFGTRGELDHRVWLVRQAETKRVDSDPDSILAVRKLPPQKGYPSE